MGNRRPYENNSDRRYRSVLRARHRPSIIAIWKGGGVAQANQPRVGSVTKHPLNAGCRKRLTPPLVTHHLLNCITLSHIRTKTRCAAMTNETMRYGASDICVATVLQPSWNFPQRRPVSTKCVICPSSKQ